MCDTMSYSWLCSDQAENLTPELAASFPSRMVFAWFDSLVWQGWRRPLAMAVQSYAGLWPL